MNYIQRRQNAHCLYPLIKDLETVLSDTTFELPIKILDRRAFVKFDGIWLCISSEYYLKYGSGSESIGTMICRLLQQCGISPLIAVDIGANLGEVSLPISKNFQHCRVFAIEASRKTFSDLCLNIGVQEFDASMIVPLNLAIAEESGYVNLSLGKEQENHILELYQEPNDHGVEFEEIQAVDIFSLINMTTPRDSMIDFLKIDIEGYEPKLANGLSEISPCLRSILIECSSKASLQQYMNLFKVLWLSDFKILGEWGRLKFATLDELGVYLQKLIYLPDSICDATDVFFYKDL